MSWMAGRDQWHEGKHMQKEKKPGSKHKGWKVSRNRNLGPVYKGRRETDCDNGHDYGIEIGRLGREPFKTREG